MPKDISEYLNFDTVDGYPFRSINSILNIPLSVERWEFLTSGFKDCPREGKYAGMFVRLYCVIDNAKFFTNTGSGIIMEQLDGIKAKKAENGETDMSFDCVIKRCGKGKKMFPVNYVETKGGSWNVGQGA